MVRSTAAVREEYARAAPRYDRRWARYIRASVRETVARLDRQAGEHLLDIGCGTGALLQAVCAAPVRPHAVGVDVSPAMLRVAAAKLSGNADPCGSVAAADAARLPFAEDSFDVVVSTSAFHFFDAPRTALAEVSRVLRPGGRLVITDWCGDYLTCRMTDALLRLRNPRHRPALRGLECERLLRESGFVVRRLDRYRISWLWGLMTVVAVQQPESQRAQR